MIGLGTIINVAGIVAGGIIGRFGGKLLSERVQDTVGKACGVCVLMLGIGGAMEGMLSVTDGKVSSGGSMLMVISLALGALAGELCNIEGLFERFGQWLKVKTGNAKDPKFVDGFVTASLTICIGAMAVVGAIEDGISGDYSVLATKAVLDFIIVMVMACSLGWGCVFSALPVGVVEGLLTLLARLIRPVMTDAALGNLSFIGSVLIFCVGVNLVFGQKVRVANLLPALVFAVIPAYF